MGISLQSRTVLITGASSGIGAATAMAFAVEGARLLLCARRVEKIDAVHDALKTAGATGVHTFALDVTRNEDVLKAIASLPDAWKSIDILVNNAGLARGLNKLQEDDVANWEEMIDTNIKGALYMTRAILPGMLQRGSGHVFGLGSTAGYMTYPGGAVYCATKVAERVLMEGLKIDLIGTPVRVTSIDPGMVETEFSKVRFGGDEARAAKVYANITPLTPDDIADAIVWAATRPAHVNIHNILLTSIDQANSVTFNRRA